MAEINQEEKLSLLSHLSEWSYFAALCNGNNVTQSENGRKGKRMIGEKTQSVISYKLSWSKQVRLINFWWFGHRKKIPNTEIYYIYVYTIFFSIYFANIYFQGCNNLITRVFCKFYTLDGIVHSLFSEYTF